MRLSDSHCHLAMVEDADALLDAARSQGVCAFLVPATRGDDLDGAVAVARRHPDVWAAVGYHPHEAKDFDDAAGKRVSELAAEERVIAIGEIGLDYHYDHSPREVQREVFARQIGIAKEHGLPVIIHNRESSDDLLAILRGPSASGVRGVIHSFTENYETGRQFVELGLYVSFSGIVTFRTAETLRDAARKLPHDRILIETDTPFLAPVPFRGKENQPAYVAKVAEQLAELWSTSAEDVAETTLRNFESLFKVTIPA